MANLIITVIAIALVAVASLMGAYYGGSAFLNNEAGANASTVLNQGQQLTGAWKAYLADNLDQTPTTLTLLQTNGYLQQLPTAPAEAGGVTASTVDVGTTGGHYYAWFDMGRVAAGGTASISDTNASACVRVVKTALGVQPTALQKLAPGAIASTTGTAATGAGNNTFGCAISTAAAPTGLNGSGTAPASGDYVAEYLLQ